MKAKIKRPEILMIDSEIHKEDLTPDQISKRYGFYQKIDSVISNEELEEIVRVVFNFKGVKIA